MTQTDNMDNLISIGELSRLTGITTHTLRVWEKRYGTPLSQRLPSGHRRYPKEDVPRLRAIAKALESGYRASKVVSGTLEELQGLLGLKEFIETGSSVSSTGEKDSSSTEMTLERWVKSIHEYDDDFLIHEFHQHWNRVGPLKFIVDFASPLIERVGIGWEQGELSVSQEHFATECLTSFLTNKWRQLNKRKNEWTILMATLPGETHNLGLLMSSVVASLTHAKIIYLGLNNPVESLIKTAKNHKPQIICLSISWLFIEKPLDTENYLIRIKEELGNDTKIICGGKGAPDNLPGIVKIKDFIRFNNWLGEFENSLILN